MELNRSEPRLVAGLGGELIDLHIADAPGAGLVKAKEEPSAFGEQVDDAGVGGTRRWGA